MIFIQAEIFIALVSIDIASALLEMLIALFMVQCSLLPLVHVLVRIGHDVVIDGVLQEVVDEIPHNESHPRPKLHSVALILKVTYSHIHLLAEVVHAAGVVQEVVGEFLDVQGGLYVYAEGDDVFEEHVVASRIDLVNRDEDDVGCISSFVEHFHLILVIYADGVVVDQHCIVLADCQVS